MSTALEEALKDVGLYWSILNSVNEFNKLEINGVLTSQFNPTPRENLFLGTYHRSCSAVGTMLALTDIKHFQALASSARSLFESSVEVALIGVVQNSVLKMTHFTRLEKLRAARKYVTFCDAHPKRIFPTDPQTYRTFITNEAANIESVGHSLWTGIKLSDVVHWSGMRLGPRLDWIDTSYKETYDCFYPLLSWYVHAGLTGIMNLRAESFAYICTLSLQLARIAFSDIIMRTAREFRLTMMNQDLDKKLELARWLPFADNEAEQLNFQRELGLTPAPVNPNALWLPVS